MTYDLIHAFTSAFVAAFPVRCTWRASWARIEGQTGRVVTLMALGVKSSGFFVFVGEESQCARDEWSFVRPGS